MASVGSGGLKLSCKKVFGVRPYSTEARQRGEDEDEGGIAAVGKITAQVDAELAALDAELEEAGGWGGVYNTAS